MEVDIRFARILYKIVIVIAAVVVVLKSIQIQFPPKRTNRLPLFVVGHHVEEIKRSNTSIVVSHAESCIVKIKMRDWEGKTKARGNISLEKGRSFEELVIMHIKVDRSIDRLTRERNEDNHMNQMI